MEEEEDGGEEKDDEDYVDDACLWHDSFLDRHNLEMEIPDHRVQLVQESVGIFVVGDEQSMPDIPLPEGVTSIPYDVVSRQSSNASFLDESNLQVNQMFEMKDEL